MEFIRAAKKHPVTFVLVGMNIVVFLLNLLTHDLLKISGALYLLQVVLGKEYWRVITAFFLHADFMHLFNNMVTLLFLGMFLEERIGGKPILAAYLTAGIGGNLLSLYSKYRNLDPAGSIGASGAIFGLDGLLLAKVLFGDNGVREIPLSRVLIMILLSVYSGFASVGIDNYAHVGGLIAGFLVGTVDHFRIVLKSGR